MALQFRRLISSGCFHKDFNNNSRICPTMLQFSAVPVFPSRCCYSTRSFIRRSGSEMQITGAKYLQGVYGNRHNISFCLDKYSRNIPFCSSWKDCSLCSVVSGGNGYMPKFLANEFLCRRSFSAGQKNVQPSVKDNVIVKNVGNGKKMSASQILCRIMKKRNKPLAVSDGFSRTKVVCEVVTRSTKAIKSEGKVLQDGAAKKRSTEAIKSERKALQDGAAKKRSTEAIKSEGKVLQDGVAKKRSTKGSGNGKDHKIFERESDSYIKKEPEGVSESCSSPSTVVINGLKKSSRAKKIGLSPVLQSTKSKSASAVTDGINVLNQQLGPLYPPSGKSVVVVESSTKAKVIQNYLGANYEVLASYGHVRDLARRSGSVRPDDNFSLVWEVPSSAWTHLKSIKMALSSTDNLILATDPDREGEAIAWHIIEMLQQQDALNENIKVARVVFHEITESSIKIALQNPRKLDSNLVNAYLARRALDYLIGFSISPLLWRKLPGCQSAGRVQSAALALICDRETEIDQFNPQEYWILGAEFMGSRSDTSGRSAISSHLTHFNSERVDRLSISSKAEAEAIQNKVNSSKFNVIAVKRSKVKRTSPMPYITSTLQQDSANKLHFSASYTMRLAQQLYEGIKLSDYESMGLITYMRTDGMHISSEAAADINSFVAERYGVQFASKSVRTYFKKVKNAQEAHESIRPTSIRRLPSTVAGILDEDSLKLYTLIWTKTMACQMESALTDMIQVDIGSKDGDVVLRSVGSRTSFSGYQAVYKDREAGVDASPYEEGDSNDATFGALHELKVKDSLSLVKVDLSQHYTKPPSRFSEGALVKTLEELGIGRPSTYASIMKVLQDRSYVTLKNRVLQPEFRGRMVSEFLSHHFSEIANYSFTADMETELDNVSAGTTEWKGLLTNYWSRFIEYCKLASDSHIHQVEKLLEEKFGYILFSSLPNDSRVCPSCKEGTLKFKVSRFGSGYFIGCDQHPKCRYIAGSVFHDEEEIADPEKTELFPHKLLGLSPDTNEKIFLKNGPYGHYVQLGDDKTGRTPQRSSVTEGTDIDSLTLEDAIALLRYPINLGKHPDDGHPVILKHSKTGFSIKHRRTICQVHKSVKPETITLATGVKLLTSKNAKQSGRPKGKRNTPKLEEADALLG